MGSAMVVGELPAEYPLWQDQTAYSRVWVVNQHHPQAADDQPGTEAAPLRSIQAALDRVQPGEQVRIHAGLYRECLRPQRGGQGPAAMIHITAAPGERVVVCGSRLHRGQWSRPRPWDEGFGHGQRIPSMSQKVWCTQLSPELVASDYRPFSLRNVEPWEETLMPWMEPVSGRPPFTLRRGLLFQDGSRLTQLHHHGDVARVPGSFWVDEDGQSLLVHPIGGVPPQSASFEVAIQEHLLCPSDIGFNYIRISGLRFAHCANSFLRASTGAVTTRGGSHWIIEDCHFTGINSSGLEFSDFPFEHRDPNPQNRGHQWRSAGHVIARRNTFYDCGTAGIRCLGTTEARVVDNLITDCGWQEAEYYFECAGIKLLMTKHTLVAGNRIARLNGACGIWLDWDNCGSRVCANVITDIDGMQGGIFIEASLSPNRIDHNVLWRIDGPGIFGGDSSRQQYDHNLIGLTSGEALRLLCHTDRHVNKVPVACVDNQVCHNLFVDVPLAVVTEDANAFSANTYWWTSGHESVDWPAWVGRGFDEDARHIPGSISFDPSSHTLRWQTSTAITADDVGPLPLSTPHGQADLTPPWMAGGRL